MNTAVDNSDPLVETRGLHISFGAHSVLRNIQLSVPRGQTVAVIGESGCGKTVLLKTLIGLIQPTAGRVIFDNHDIAAINEVELTRQRVRFGFVFQNAALFDSLTIGQNIAFPMREHRQMSNEEVKDNVHRLLHEVGLPASIVTKKPAELSGGMRKRVGIARALALEPEVVLYDEPTTGLDPIMSDVINELMMRTRMGRTSIIVTHDMRTARKVADRVVMLYPLARLSEDAPQVIYDGPPSQMEHAADRRVTQFVKGEAGERLSELREEAY